MAGSSRAAVRTAVRRLASDNIMPAGLSPLERISTKVGRPASDLRTERVVDWLATKELRKPDDIATCAGELTQNPHLEVLDMSGNQFGKEAAGSCADILNGCPSLRGLRLDVNNLRDGIAPIAEAVAAHKGLEWLSIRANAIKGATCESIADAIAHSVSLKWLDISSNAFGPVGGAAIADGLARAGTSSKLEYLNFGAASIRPSGAQKFAEALADDGVPLKSLILRENFVGTEGALHFASMLKCNTELRELTLCDNNIDKEGAAAIAEAMEANSTLQYLNIRLNDFNVQKPILGMLREAKERSDANRASPLELKLL